MISDWYCPLPYSFKYRTTVHTTTQNQSIISTVKSIFRATDDKKDR